MPIQVSGDGLVVHHTGRLKASVSGLAMTAHFAALHHAQVASLGLVVHHTDAHEPVEIASAGLIVHHTDAHEAIPVIGTYFIVHRTLGFYIHAAPMVTEAEIGPSNVRVLPFGGTKMRQAYFNVLLSNSTYKSVSVNWTTLPGTANPPAEYTTMSGTLTFEPGEISKIIVVPVREYDADISDTFTILLSAPINATISDASGTALL